MKNYMLILALGVLLAPAAAQQKDLKQLVTEFDKILGQQYRRDEPGATALVARKGQVIYKKAVGMANLEFNVPMQTDQVFRIGSVTKQFTAVAILQLVEQGKLGLQDDITKFIPDYPTHGHTITIEHLLTHTSGIRSYTSMPDYEERMALDLTPAQMIDHFRHQPMLFAPGTNWAYSNSGYFLLGYIIEKVTGQTYGTYLEENIFKPTGMTRSLYGSNTRIIPNRAGTYSKGEQGYENARALSMTQPYSAGSIQSTVEDLFKWHQALQAGKLVKKENLAKAFTSYRLPDGRETGYGYGWSFGYVRESPSVEHGGGINGARTMVIYLPQEDVFVAVFSSCDCNSPADIAARLAALAMGNPYPSKEIFIENTVLQEYTGVYENEKGEQRIITVSDNRLYSQRGRNPKFNIKAYEKDKFFFDDVLWTITFGRDDKGAIKNLATSSREGTEVWHKTDKPIPTANPDPVKVDETILETYVGEYAITPDFTFMVTREQDRLFVQATGQNRFEILAEAENRFFMQENDARFEFVKDDTGKVTKAVLNQGGRNTEARKIK